MTSPNAATPRWTPDVMDVDVLVLGSGLAGLRAALSAKRADPGLDVAVVGLRRGPSGSSFANVNNALGIQVLATDENKRAFAREVADLAAPGWIDPALVDILAEDSLARFNDMVEIGFPFTTDAGGNVQAVNGCFSPEHNRAYIFTDLGRAFANYSSAVASAGARFLSGYAVGGILTDSNADGRAVGAWLAGREPGRALAVRAKAVVAALGGPAALFAWNMAAPGAGGDAYGLLAKAGAGIVNAGFLQYMWAEPKGRTFWSAHRAMLPGVKLRTPSGGEIEPLADLPEGVRRRLEDQAAIRSTHCPVGYNMPDSGLDSFLADHLDEAGLLHAFEPERGWITLAPMAHAGNGGAVIDAHARTGVPGLYACGECASGMHGANRMGGASVLATQVFGHRAGIHAAATAADTPRVSGKIFAGLAGQAVPTGMRPASDAEHVRWLKRNMQRHAILGGRPGLEAFNLRLHYVMSTVGSWRFKLMARSAAVVAGHLAARSRGVQSRGLAITSAA